MQQADTEPTELVLLHSLEDGARGERGGGVDSGQWTFWLSTVHCPLSTSPSSTSPSSIRGHTKYSCRPSRSFWRRKSQAFLVASPKTRLVTTRCRPGGSSVITLRSRSPNCVRH